MSAAPVADAVACRDECGRSVPADQLETSGWEWLPIQKRYRCPHCWRALMAVNTTRESDDAAAE